MKEQNIFYVGDKYKLFFTVILFTIIFIFLNFFPGSYFPILGWMLALVNFAALANIWVNKIFVVKITSNDLIFTTSQNQQYNKIFTAFSFYKLVFGQLSKTEIPINKIVKVSKQKGTPFKSDVQIIWNNNISGLMQLETNIGTLETLEFENKFTVELRKVNPTIVFDK